MAEKITVPGLRVAAKVAGFRRAGRSWGSEPTDVPVSDFTTDQMDALKADPGLVVSNIEIEIEMPADEQPVAPVVEPATSTKKKK